MPVVVVHIINVSSILFRKLGRCTYKSYKQKLPHGIVGSMKGLVGFLLFGVILDSDGGNENTSSRGGRRLTLKGGTVFLARILLRGTIVNRTYGKDKNQYISLF